MSFSNYDFALVKVIINSENKDVIGNGEFLALSQMYRKANLAPFSVSEPLKRVIKEGDFVVVDLKNSQIIRIIRNSTRDSIEAIYQDVYSKLDEPAKQKTALSG